MICPEPDQPYIMSIAILLASYSLDLSAGFFWRLRAGERRSFNAGSPIISRARAKLIASDLPLLGPVMPLMIEHLAESKPVEKTDAIAAISLDAGYHGDAIRTGAA
jgi:hypothetical protein